MNLLIDADDTLWENIRVFNRINADFASWLAPGCEVETLAELDVIQRTFVKLHGYGAKTFALSLTEGIRQLAGREPSEADSEEIAALIEPLKWDSVELLEGVEQTLAELQVRHELTLFTKGDPSEQQRKTDVSGLGVYFSRVHIVDEKHEETYRDFVEDNGLDPSATWMIGNSPRSDIAPALKAGIGAVYIPHADTWGHEDGEIDLAHERLLQIDSFPELLRHF